MMRARVLAGLVAATLGPACLIPTAGPAAAASCTSPKVIYHTLIKDHGTSVGYIDLEYSVACHSARAHVHSIYVAHPYDTHGASALLHRNSDGAEKTCYVKEGKQDCTTSYLYDKGVSSYAEGSIDMYPINNDLAHARTSSY